MSASTFIHWHVGSNAAAFETRWELKESWCLWRGRKWADLWSLWLQAIQVQKVTPKVAPKVFEHLKNYTLEVHSHCKYFVCLFVSEVYFPEYLRYEKQREVKHRGPQNTVTDVVIIFLTRKIARLMELLWICWWVRRGRERTYILGRYFGMH